MSIEINDKSIINQDVDCIVNAWNRNFIPYWLLIPQGVSKAIKASSGNRPFIELQKYGCLKSGEAVATSSGDLPFKKIIHVAGINFFWFATQKSIVLSINNACQLAIKKDLKSIAIPLVGAGTGGKNKKLVKALIIKTAKKYEKDLQIIISIPDLN